MPLYIAIHPAVAAHDFHHHDAIVGFGGGVHAVDGFGGDVDGCVKSESVVGSGQVVVDRLWDANHLDSLFIQFLGD